MAPRRARAALPVALACALAGAVGTLAAAPAWAAAPSQRERARARLAEGASAFDAGDYVQALRAFQDAYALVPSPKIHFNFAVTYSALGRYAEALGAFERFLAQVPDASPENLAEAREQAASLRRAVAFVEVTCDVAGAQVVVSGRSIGTTPIRAAFPVDPGSHDLVVRKAGLPPHVREFTATAGGRHAFQVTLALSPAPASPPLAPGPAPAVAAAPGPAQPRSRRWQTPAAWATGIGAGVLLGGGVVLELLASSQYRAFNANEACGSGEPMAGGGRCDELLADGRRKRAFAIAALATGGAAAVASVVLAVWGRRGESGAPPRAAACAPMFAGVSCAVVF